MFVVNNLFNADQAVRAEDDQAVKAVPILRPVEYSFFVT
ncbi:hypothetical protein DSUL_100201 [Desulfovibrionales bacterium]